MPIDEHFQPVDTARCEDVFATSQRNQMWLYTCRRPEGHGGLCRDFVYGATWHRGQQREVAP